MSTATERAHALPSWDFMGGTPEQREGDKRDCKEFCAALIEEQDVAEVRISPSGAIHIVFLDPAA